MNKGDSLLINKNILKKIKEIVSKYKSDRFSISEKIRVLSAGLSVFAA